MSVFVRPLDFKPPITITITVPTVDRMANRDASDQRKSKRVT
jgi:hypothetical protein